MIFSQIILTIEHIKHAIIISDALLYEYDRTTQVIQIIAGNNIISTKKSAAREIKELSSVFTKMINPGIIAHNPQKIPFRIECLISSLLKDSSNSTFMLLLYC